MPNKFPVTDGTEEVLRDLIRQQRLQCIEELRQQAVSYARNLRRFSFPADHKERRMAYGSRSAAEVRLAGFCAAIEILNRALPQGQQNSGYFEEHKAKERAAELMPLPEESARG